MTRGVQTGLAGLCELSLLLVLLYSSRNYCAEVVRHHEQSMDITGESAYSNEVEKPLEGGATKHRDEDKGEEQVEQKASDIGDASFGYDKDNGPRLWSHHFPRCKGSHQSPVNLDTSTAHTVHRPQLFWWNYFLKPDSMELFNEGHTVKVLASWTNTAETPFHWASPNGVHFVFDHLHFHWGPDDSLGSEHTLNNEKFPLEMHVVHYKKEFNSIVEAISVPGGLRVIGVLFRLSEHNNTALDDVLAALSGLHSPGSRVHIEPFAVSKLLPTFPRQYLTYNGSLTTPPCFESVSWVVRKEPLTVSSRQMQEFRSLLSLGNFRPIQPLNEREVLQVR